MVRIQYDTFCVNRLPWGPTDEAPRPEDLAWLLANLPDLYDSLTEVLANAETAPVFHTHGEEVHEVLAAGAIPSVPIVPEPDQAHVTGLEPVHEEPVDPADSAEPDDDRVAGRIAEKIAAALDERQTMLADSGGQPLRNLEAYKNWRERARTTIDEWHRHAGSDTEIEGDPIGWDVGHLKRAFDFDDRAVGLISRWERHEVTAGTDPFAGSDALSLVLRLRYLAAQAVINRELRPRPLADTLVRYDAHNEAQANLEKERAAESRARED